MHGLVALDAADKVLRPAILWNDGRTARQTDYLNKEIGRETLSKYTGNIAFAGFTAPKILWMKENEPELYAAIAKIMLPKDYLVYRMTGRARHRLFRCFRHAAPGCRTQMLEQGNVRNLRCQGRMVGPSL